MGYFDLGLLCLAGFVLVATGIVFFWSTCPAAKPINERIEGVLLRWNQRSGEATPFKRNIAYPLAGMLCKADALVNSVSDSGRRAAVRILALGSAAIASLFLSEQGYLLISDNPAEVAVALVIVSPALFGLGIWFWAPAEAINAFSARAGAYHDTIRVREGWFSRYFLRPFAWGFRHIDGLTSSARTPEFRAGLRVTAWIYWALAATAMAVVAVVVVFYIVVAILVIALAFFILGQVLGGDNDKTHVDNRSGRARERVIKRDREFWGDEKEVIYEDGHRAGEIRVEERGGILGIGAEKVKVEYDDEGREVAQLKQEQRGGILGIGAENVEVRYNSDGEEVAHSKIEERGGILGIGAEHVRVEYDKDGKEVSQTKREERGGILGIGAESVKVTRPTDQK